MHKVNYARKQKMKYTKQNMRVFDKKFSLNMHQ